MAGKEEQLFKRLKSRSFHLRLWVGVVASFGGLAGSIFLATQQTIAIASLTLALTAALVVRLVGNFSDLAVARIESEDNDELKNQDLGLLDGGDEAEKFAESVLYRRILFRGHWEALGWLLIRRGATNESILDFRDDLEVVARVEQKVASDRVNLPSIWGYFVLGITFLPFIIGSIFPPIDSVLDFIREFSELVQFVVMGWICFWGVVLIVGNLWSYNVRLKKERSLRQSVSISDHVRSSLMCGGFDKWGESGVKSVH